MRRGRSAGLALLVCLFTTVPKPDIGRAEPVVMDVPAAGVGKYEKVEFNLRLDAAYQNPFDPGEVDLVVLLTTPSGGRIVVPAFACQDYQREKLDRGPKPVDWIYPQGAWCWKARFAPLEIGTHQAVARLKDRRGTFQSKPVQFESRASTSRGFLRVSASDPRFLEFSEGQSFFAIGQNLAFIGPSQYANLAKAEEMFARLSENGANFLRIWTCCEDWAMALEARKSAWGRSWDWKPPIAALPDSTPGQPERKCVALGGEKALPVSPSHRVALRPNTRYVFSMQVRSERPATLRVEWSDTAWDVPSAAEAKDRWITITRERTTGPKEMWLDRLSLRQSGGGSVWLDRLSLREAAGGAELLWEADVNRPKRGFYNPVDCFLLDEVVRAAEQRGIYLQLCLITRDLYMGSLKKDDSPEYQQAIDDAKRFLRYVVARWGYSTHVAAWEYFNEIDPNLPTDRFYRELGEYLEQIDPYRHLRTTSSWAPAPKDCRHEKLDLAETHYYLRPADRQRLKDEVEAALDRTAFLREHAPARPALIGEFGLADDRWREDDLMRADREMVHFHNSLWASALSGASGTALFWWWDELDRKDAYRHYRPLAAYLADIPFTTAGLQRTSAELMPAAVRLVGVQGPRSAYLWLFNPQASWLAQADGTTPSEIRGARLRIPGLAPGDYRVEWWDTGEGKVRTAKKVAVAGDLSIDVPAFTADLACKVTCPESMAKK